MLSTGCGEGGWNGAAIRYRPGQPIDRAATDPVSFLEELKLDLAERRDRTQVRVSGATVRFDAEGAHLAPEDRDPMIELGFGPAAFDRVEVRLESGSAGLVQLYWKQPGQVYSESQKLSHPIGSPGTWNTYLFELPEATSGAEEGRQFRLDPIDRHEPVSVRSIRLFRSPGAATAQANERLRRVELGQDTRDVVALGCGERFEMSTTSDETEALDFGFARPWFSTRSIQLRLDLLAWPIDRGLWREAVGAEAGPGFADQRIPVPPPGRTGAQRMLRWTATCDAREVAAARRRERVILSLPSEITARGSTRPDLVWISMDTVGAQAFEQLLAAGKLPNLSRLAAAGVRLADAHASSSLTHLSHAAMFTGLRPETLGFVDEEGRIGASPTMAELLSAAGYRTAAFTGGVLVRPSFGFDRGFARFYREDTLFKPLAEMTDLDSLVAHAEQWLSPGQGAPYYLFFHTYEAHGPYFPRAEDLEVSRHLGTSGRQVGFLFPQMRGRLAAPKSELGELIRIVERSAGAPRPAGDAEAGAAALEGARRAYFDEIERIDAAVGRLVETVSRLGRLDRTLFVVTADHGESFFEHGLLEHSNLYEENLRVPAILSGTARVPPGRIVQERTFLLDLLPTVLELLGLRSDSKFDGRSLVPLLGGARDPGPAPGSAFVPGEGRAFYRGARKWIERSALFAEDFGHHEAFDISRDPTESKPSQVADPSQDTAAGIDVATESFPGHHLDLSALRGESIEIEAGAARTRDDFLGFDLTPVGPALLRDGGVARRVVVGPRAQLVAIGADRSSVPALRLRSEPGGELVTIELVDLPALPARRSIVVNLAGGTAVLHAWFVTPRAGGSSASPLGAEDEARLRALGYVR